MISHHGLFFIIDQTEISEHRSIMEHLKISSTEETITISLKTNPMVISCYDLSLTAQNTAIQLQSSSIPNRPCSQ